MEIDVNDIQSSHASIIPDIINEETKGQLELLEKRRLARELPVTTNDDTVKTYLRSLGQVVTYFGEQKNDRRDRLKRILLDMRDNGQDISHMLLRDNTVIDQDDDKEMDGEEDEDDKQDEFFTLGSEDLYNSRVEMAKYAETHTISRLQQQSLEAKVPLKDLMQIRESTFAQLKSMDQWGLQTASRRPISCIRCSPFNNTAVTGSWGGDLTLWDITTLERLYEYSSGTATSRAPAYDEYIRVESVAWNPSSNYANTFATSGSDGIIKLWSANPDSYGYVAELTGHRNRVFDVEYHPSGKYLGSVSADESWRLWDLEKMQQLVLQEGHQYGVTSLAFQCDGSLVCTGGADANARIWDLRSGKSILVLGGHTREIRCSQFNPNGYQVITGSNDDTIRVWDLRQRACLSVIPAHKSSVTDVRFFQNAPPTANGFFKGLNFISASVDGDIKIWASDDSSLVKTMSRSSDARVLGVDISYTGDYVLSCDDQRNIKLYGCQ